MQLLIYNTDSFYDYEAIRVNIVGITTQSSVFLPRSSALFHFSYRYPTVAICILRSTDYGNNCYLHIPEFPLFSNFLSIFIYFTFSFTSSVWFREEFVLFDGLFFFFFIVIQFDFPI